MYDISISIVINFFLTQYYINSTPKVNNNNNNVISEETGLSQQSLMFMHLVTG